MAVDTKDVQIMASNVLKILMKTCFIFLKERPIALCTLLSFILVYILVPSIFWYLIYSLPFVVFIVISVKIYASDRKAKDINKDENGSDSKSCRKIQFEEDGNKKYNSMHARSVRRRRAMETIRENYTESSFLEKRTISSNASQENYTQGDKSALIQEENAKEIRGMEVESIINDAGSNSSNASRGFRTQFDGDSSSTSQRFSIGGVEIEGISSENTEDEEDEDTRGDERKAVLWTEDDQKNLMDLGISEMERNKRLDSLIARRRSRKLWSLQVRKTLMNKGGVNEPPSHIASLMIPRHNPSLVGNGHFSPTPGSAPSVLLPMRNPFDLPYEPHEEKPILTGDSFHQEFMVAHHKDMMLCRHESFSLGAFLPVELRQDLHETSLYLDHGTNQVNLESPESSKIRTTQPPDLENDDKIIKQEASQEAEPKLKIENMGDHVVTVQASEQGPDLVDIHHEVQTKSVIVEDHNSRLSSPSSSEEEEPFRRIDKDAILKSLSSPSPRNIATDREGSGRIDDILHDYGPSVPENTTREGRIYYSENTMHHTPSHSIASDLQVEVSEFGSPPHTSDWNISSIDEEIPICDGKIKKEVPYCSEDRWVASSHLSGVDENESRSREIREVREEEIIGVGFSRISDKSGIPISSSAMAGRVTDRDFIDRNSENEPSEESEANTSVKYNVHEHQASSPELLQASTPEVLAFPLYEKVQQSKGTSPAHLPCNIEFENLEKPPQPANMFKEQSSTILSHPDCHVNTHTDNKKTIHEIGDEDREFTSQVYTGDMLNLCKTTGSSSAEHGQLGKSNDIGTVFEIKSSVEQNGNPRSSEKFKLDTGHLFQSEDVTEKSQVVKSNGIQDSNVSQSDGIASSSLPEIVVAPICTASASSILPDPKLWDHAGMDDHSYPSNSLKLMHINIQESDIDGIQHNERSVAKNESLKPRDAQDALVLACDSRLKSSNGQDAESFQEPSNSDNSKRQLGIINNVDDSHILQNNDKENLTTSKQVAIQPSTKQGGDQTEKWEKTCPKYFGSHGSQLEGLVEPNISSICHKQVGESSKPTFSEEIQGLSQNMSQHEEMITTIQDNCVPESTINAENEAHSAVVGTSRVSHDINDPPEMELMPEAGDEQVSTAALSSTLSPKSVLQPNFSMEQGSVSYLTHEVQMEIQQSDRYTTENYMVDERGNSTLSSTPIQSAALLVEDRNVETIQNPSTSSMMPTEETNSIQSVNELVIHDEKMQITEPNEFFKDTSGILRSHETVAELEKPTVDTNSIRGKNDEMPAHSTAYSNTADQRKNFDTTLNNEQDKMIQLAFSFWTKVISGTEENE